MKSLKILPILAIISAFLNCKSAGKSSKLIEQGYVKGLVMDDRKIAGCNFSIQLEDQKLITPQNLDEKFKKHNLKVWVKYNILKKQPITNCMRGQVVEIIDITLQ